MKASYASAQRAPDFTSKDVRRQRIRLEEEASGAKLVLLDFWASWCGPCRQEYPYLKRLHEAYADQGLKIIGINLDTDRRKALSAAESAGLDYRHVYDGKGWRNAVAALYQVHAIPQTFLLDSDLKLVAAGLRGAQLEKVMPFLLETEPETLLASFAEDESSSSSGAADSESFVQAIAAGLEGMVNGAPPPTGGFGLNASEIDFEARGLDGETIRLADEAAGAEYVLLDFWASWCGPCRVEFPHLRRLNERYRDRGLKVIGVSLDENRRDAESAARSAGLDYPHVFDGKGWENAVAVQYQVRSIPHTVLLDKNLNVVAVGLRGPSLVERIGDLVGRGRPETVAANTREHASVPGGSRQEEPAIEDPGVAALLVALGSPDRRARANAALEIGQLGGKAAEAVPNLVQVLKGDPYFLVRARAATALGRIGLRAEESVPALIEALENDDDPSTRRAAARALQAIGPDAKEAVAALVAALDDSSLNVRTSAADALETIRN
jgi:thiol-disulfide isomerase/thioredoxin